MLVLLVFRVIVYKALHRLPLPTRLIISCLLYPCSFDPVRTYPLGNALYIVI